MSVDPRVNAALSVRFDSDAGDDLSLREYLGLLLERVWIEGEGFSGKRPFGNSGWEYDLYATLVKAGLMAGEIDEDGDLDELDSKDARKLVLDCIRAMTRGDSP